MKKKIYQNNKIFILIIFFLILGIIFATLNKYSFSPSEKKAETNRIELLSPTIQFPDITTVPTPIPRPPFDYNGCVNTVKSIGVQCVLNCAKEAQAQSQSCPQNNINTHQICLNQLLSWNETCGNNCQTTANQQVQNCETGNFP